MISVRKIFPKPTSWFYPEGAPEAVENRVIAAKTPNFLQIKGGAKQTRKGGRWKGEEGDKHFGQCQDGRVV